MQIGKASRGRMPFGYLEVVETLSLPGSAGRGTIGILQFCFPTDIAKTRMVGINQRIDGDDVGGRVRH